METNKTKIQDLAKSVSVIKADKHTSTAAFKGIAVGIVYSLKKADELRYEKRDRLSLSLYDRELTQTVDDIIKDCLKPESEWTPGFYFGSALVRLAAGYHRLLKILTGKNDTRKELHKFAVGSNLIDEDDDSHLTTVYKDVNEFKHGLDGWLGGIKSDMETAIKASNQLLKLYHACIKHKKLPS